MSTTAIIGIVKRRIFLSACNSVKGLQACFAHEEAFRLEVALAVILIPLGIFLGDSGTEKVLMVGSCVLVMIVELLNSAVETVVDRIGLEYSELSGRAKDMGSAAVMLSMALVVVTWGLMLF